MLLLDRLLFSCHQGRKNSSTYVYTREMLLHFITIKSHRFARKSRQVDEVTLSKSYKPGGGKIDGRDRRESYSPRLLSHIRAHICLQNVGEKKDCVRRATYEDMAIPYCTCETGMRQGTEGRRPRSVLIERSIKF